jgi:serine kinase of HPr protein (carbohydrate metabolism regulator)
MPPSGESTIHASCVLVGRSALLIRGPSGSGKSRLAFALLQASRAGLLPPAWLVADDRVRIVAAHGRLVASAPEPTREKIEIHGLGIRRGECEPRALVNLVIDLEAADGGRLPEAAALSTEIMGVKLSRLPIRPGESAFLPVLATFLPIAEV